MAFSIITPFFETKIFFRQFNVLILLVIFICCAKNLNAQQDSTPIALNQVVVMGKENPAHRLIRQAVANRERNAAYFCESFRYYSYQKLWITPQNISDTNSRFDEQYLFLTENVTENLFKKPNKEIEKLIASKTSGIDNPIFNIIFRRLQFSNFYKSDYLDLLETKFVSPVSKTALKQYSFELLDTLFSFQDTIFVVSFEPKSVFKSLRGKLYIHSENYAIQRIEAEPYQIRNLQISIIQEYQKQSNGTWFPSQISAVMPFPKITPETDSLNLQCYSTISIKDVTIDLPLANKEFGLNDLEESIASEKSNISFLNTYRDSSLTQKELRTYVVIDSIGKSLKLDRRISMLPSLLSGKLPLGPIDVDLFNIVDFTTPEGWRFGLGLYTNNRLSKAVHFGGYFAYGLKDQMWKWGGKVDWQLYRPRDIVLNVKVFHDITESGQNQLITRDEMGLLNGEFYRHWIINKFDESTTASAKLQMRISKSFTASITSVYSHNRTMFDYDYIPITSSSAEPSFYSYNNFSIRAGIRFSFLEFTYRTSELTLFQPSNYPVIQLQYERGIKGVFLSQFNYNKINTRIHYHPRYKKLGNSYFVLNAGVIDVPLPYSLQYVAPAGYEQIGFDGIEQFAVMRPNEFLSDAYFFLFLRHNFGKMTHNQRFSPRIEICQNIGFGWLRHPEIHDRIDFKTMQKGYFESGIMIHNLLSYKNILAMGLGVFYRYGAYAYRNEINNFAFKVSLTVPLLD